MKTKKLLHTNFIKFLTLENYISHHFQGKEKGIEISKGVSRKYQMVDL
nr:hypothetical protein [uncultured Flavobacterium sp.]